MPEENISKSLPVKIRRIRKPAAKKKKKAEKPPFPVSKNLDIEPVLPRADFKIEESLAKKSQSKTIYRKLALSFAALTALLSVVIFYYSFSRVTLAIIPIQEKISDSSIIEIADQSADASGRIAGVVRQAPLEQSRVFTSSGKEVLGQEVTGKVTIINNYMKNQPLVATTRILSSDNKLFRLKNTVNVPAGGKAEVEVYANEAKPDMAIGPSKFTIPGLWAGIQDKIYAQSGEPMKYSEKVKYMIKQSDIDGAVAELRRGLLDSARQTISQAYQEYDQTLLEIDDNSISQEPDGKVGEEKQNFTLKMKIMITLAAFKDDDVFDQAKTRLIASLADDREIAEFSKKDLVYSLESFDLSQGLATVKVTASAKTTLKPDAKIIKKNNLAGLSLDQLKSYLDSLPEVAGYEIKFFPSFMKKVPRLADRIEIVIKK